MRMHSRKEKDGESRGNANVREYKGRREQRAESRERERE